MTYILDKISNNLVEVEIIIAEKGNVPLKTNGWNFNWKQLVKENNSIAYILRTIDTPEQTEGILLLKIENEMMIMDVVEIAPHNIGNINKKYDHVAGCLIAFACRESFKLDSHYKGYLTFLSKTNLIKWYSEKYGAELAMGQKMFISPENGEKLINEYLYK